MALIIDLKPKERVIIGDAVITNDRQRTRLHVEGDAPILREKDIMRAEEADTPCKRIYLAVQLMYLARNPRDHFENYFALVKEVQDAAPSMAGFILQINEQIISGSFYKALKEARKLIDYEQEVMSHA